jgi:hypothetical protein
MGAPAALPGFMNSIITVYLNSCFEIHDTHQSLTLTTMIHVNRKAQHISQTLRGTLR